MRTPDQVTAATRVLVRHLAGGCGPGPGEPAGRALAAHARGLAHEARRLQWLKLYGAHLLPRARAAWSPELPINVGPETVYVGDYPFDDENAEDDEPPEAGLPRLGFPSECALRHTAARHGFSVAFEKPWRAA